MIFNIQKILLTTIFVISTLDILSTNEVINEKHLTQFKNQRITRVKRCRPGGIDCRMYRVVAPCPPSICGPPSRTIASESVIHERYVAAPVSHRTEYYHSSSSSSSSASASSSSSSSISTSGTYQRPRVLQSPSSKIIERRLEKFVQKPVIEKTRIVQEHVPIVQQKVEKIVQEPVPIIQQKVERIVQRPVPVVQQKFERIIQEHIPVVHQTIVQEKIPVVQQKVERIVQQPVVQQKFEKIVQEHVPIVQQKTVQTVVEHENIVQRPVVQQKFEKIIQEVHVKKPIVSLRITACPEGHYLSADGTHCKHIDCESGFEFNDALLKCVDIDECTVSTACLRDEQCINTYGSYVCRKICTQAGFRLNEARNACEDIDECLEGLHTCGSQQTCINTPGSYRCECPQGYRIDGSQCIDINECLESHDHLCPHDVSTCENTPGSYYCKCKRGFEKDHRGRCVDVDECQINNGGCSQRCINKYGSYECHCNDGYKISSDSHTCIDIDECVEYSQSGICSPQVSTCINTPGSYVCQCKTGFRDPDGSGKHCVDVDECLEQTNLCEQKCINTFGSYKCACNRGYRAVGPHRCEDIDECHEGDFINDVAFSRFRHDEHGHPKLCQGGCENSAGSYRCTCPSGYNLVHNHHCVDIDECREYGYCRGANQTCVNLGGSFRCVDDRCPPGYHKDGIQCKMSERLVYAEICDDPTEVCNIDRVICYSYAYIAFRSKLVKQEETTITTTSSNVKGHIEYHQHAVATKSHGKGHEFFTFVVPVEPPIIVDFKKRLVSVKSPRPGVRPARDEDFEMRRTKDNEVRLALMSSLEGPQDIELEIEAKMYKNGLQIGKNLAIVTVFISEYEF